MKTYLSTIAIAFLLLISPVVLSAQKKNDKKEEKKIEYKFTDLKVLPHTSVKNQASSGTCWSFSGLGMLEAEIMRIKGENDSINLSAMWVVRNIYKEKVEKYVRMHGNTNLSAGGAFFDVIFASSKYGMIPDNVYTGLNYGTDTHNHDELDNIIGEFGKGIVKGKKLTTAWCSALNGIIDSYFGTAPEKFMYNGVEYTPESFAKYTGLNLDDYVSITSYTHHPYYKPFVLEIPDNWIWESSYNLPMDEMVEIIDNAIEKGYTIAWGADVSEKGFSKDRATVPEEKKTEEVGTDQAKWTKKKAEAVIEQLPTEQIITQEMRQVAFDNYETTDDHGMVIVGTAQDQNGKLYYKVKNSWGVGGEYKGYLYVSLPYVQYKTMNYVVHKNALPNHIKIKLNL